MLKTTLKHVLRAALENWLSLDSVRRAGVKKILYTAFYKTGDR